MNTICIAILLAVFASACDQQSLPPIGDATGAENGGDGAADMCAIPDGYTLVLTTCPGTPDNTCIAQDSAFRDAPVGTTKINLAGCHLDARPDVVCIAACP